MKLHRLTRAASYALDVLWRVGVLFLAVAGALALLGLSGPRALLPAAMLTGLIVFGILFDRWCDGAWPTTRRRWYVARPDKYRR